MKILIKNHFLIQKRRGLISPDTTLDQFMTNLDMSYTELINAHADDIKANRSPSDDFMTELTSLMLVGFHLMQNSGVSFEEEVAKVNKRQEGMISRLTFTV